MKQIAIIGGGITGLSAAYYLKKWTKDHPDQELDIKLFEASSQAGGKLQTVQKDGLTMERGADSFLKRKPAGMALISDLQLESKLIENSTGQSYVATKSGLHAIPRGTYMGLPILEDDFLASKLLSMQGKKRALAEVDLPQRTVTGDQSLGLFLRRRFGDEIVDELLAPLLSGIYSSDVNEMSLKATFPQFYEYEQRYGSVLKGLRQNMPLQKVPKTPQFATLKGGLSTLIDALSSHLEEISLSQKIINIKKNLNKYILTNQNGETFKVDYVICAIPFPSFKSLWEAPNPLADYEITHRSVGNFVLSFNRNDWQEKIEGTGFVAAKSSGLPITACTWVDQKWPEAVQTDDVLLRVYIGRANEQARLEQDEAVLKKIVLEALVKTMGAKAEPKQSLFTKWSNLMPQYTLNHQEKVHDMRLMIGQHLPGVFVAGASYDGVGIPDCIQSAKDVVGQLIEIL